MPGRTVVSAVAAGGSCIMRANSTGKVSRAFCSGNMLGHRLMRMISWHEYPVGDSPET